MPRLQDIPAESRATAKRCVKCGAVKAVTEYYVNISRPDGLSVYCVPCHKAARNLSQRGERERVLEALGGRCVRCLLKDPRVLQIDHRDGGGNQDRVTNGWHSVLKAILQGDRKDEFQLLCANCNIIKRLEAREFRKAETYTRAVAHERTFKGWKDRRPPTEQTKQQISESLKRAYADGRRNKMI